MAFGGFQPIAFQPAFQQEAALAQTDERRMNLRRGRIIRKVTRETVIHAEDRSSGVRRKRRDTLI